MRMTLTPTERLTGATRMFVASAGVIALPRKTRGVALISILLVVVIATVLGVKMTTEQHFSINRARNYFDQGKVRQYALGGEELARQILYKDFADNPQKDVLTEEWASTELKFEFEDGAIEMSIEDLQGKFNLNSLVASSPARLDGGSNANAIPQSANDTETEQAQDNPRGNLPGSGRRPGNAASAEMAMTRFRVLLNQQGIDPVFADRIRDWIDINQDVTQLGAEDFDYLGLDRPYRTADTPMFDLTELRLILDIDPLTFSVLEPLVTTLPASVNLINVNTAPSVVIQAIAGNGLSPELAEVFTVNRNETEGFDSVEAFLQDDSLAGQGISPDGLSVQSGFFKVSVRARVDDRFGYLTSIIQRNPTDGSMRVIYRDASKKIYPVVASNTEASAS